MERVIESSTHGIIVVKKVANPKNLTWGSIVLMKNDNQIVAAWTFRNHQDKTENLITANQMVLRRKDRYNKYDVKVQYGVSVHEHLSRAIAKAKEAGTTPD